jgi:hypothetical protein
MACCVEKICLNGVGYTTELYLLKRLIGELLWFECHNNGGVADGKELHTGSCESISWGLPGPA